MKASQTYKKQSSRNSLMIYSLAVSIQALMTVACAPQKNQQLARELSGESIVAGTAVTEKDPISASTVAILIESPMGQSLCTGTLVAKNIVVTAAHCFGKGASRAAVLFGSDLEKSQSVFAVDKVNVHPQYASKNSGEGGWNDIALLHFVGDAPATSEVVEILKDATLLTVGLQAVTAGYGSTPKDGNGQDSGVLRKVTLTLQDPVFEKTELLFPLTSKGGSTCHGDSGGPIYVQKQGKLVLVGVTSRGTSASCDNVSIFTNVSSHLEFINESIESFQEVKL